MKSSGESLNQASRPRRAAKLWPALAALTVVSHLLGLACLRWLAHGLPWQLLLWLLAGLFWLGTLSALLADSEESEGQSPRAILYIVLLGLLMRLPALALPVVHSDDVYRYLFDGAVQQAGLDPYAGSPEAPLYAPVRAAHPELFAHINHRELPTIYPPAAQTVFAAGARLCAEQGRAGAFVSWRLLCGATELLLWAVLLRLYQNGQRGEAGPGEKGGPGRRWLLLWALCPLPAIEIWLNGHLDVFGILLLMTALLFLGRSAVRSAITGALLMLSLLTKPLALAVIPGLLSLRGFGRRAVLALVCGGLLAALLCFWPYRQAGLNVAGSLGEYSRRWRSNDGAYALLDRAAAAGVAAWYAPPYYDPWQHRGLARIISGRDRDTVWPDELAGFLARSVVGLSLLGLLCLGLWRRLLPAPLGLVLLSGYALLTPTLHPWYLLWPLVLAPLFLRGAAPALLLVWLSPLAYLPLSHEWAGRGHYEPVWSRLLQHGVAWLALAFALFSDALRRRKQLPGRSLPS